MPRAARSVGFTGRLRGRPGIVASVVVVALLLTLVIGVGLGSVRIGPADSIGVILWRAFGMFNFEHFRLLVLDRFGGRVHSPRLVLSARAVLRKRSVMRVSRKIAWWI
jgi:hypothetical protein